MKQYLINISILIKRGILRIFPRLVQIFSLIFVKISSIFDAILPKSFSSKATNWSAFLLGFSFLILVGCSASRQMATQHVHDIQRDTVYMTNQQYDSIYIYKDKLTDRSKDTIYIKDVSIEYRYKMLRDTIRIVKRDSIPYQVTVVETKEITRPLTWFDHLTRLTFWFVIGSLLTWIYIRIRKSRVH